MAGHRHVFVPSRIHLWCCIVFAFRNSIYECACPAFGNVHVRLCFVAADDPRGGFSIAFLCNMGRDVPSKCIKYSTLHFSLNALGFSVLSTWGSDPRVALGAFCMSFQKTLQTILSCVSHARAELVGQCCVCPICAGFCNVGAN